MRRGTENIAMHLLPTVLVTEVPFLHQHKYIHLQKWLKHMANLMIERTRLKKKKLCGP
jgi:hypothetical protein